MKNVYVTGRCENRKRVSAALAALLSAGDTEGLYDWTVEPENTKESYMDLARSCHERFRLLPSVEIMLVLLPGGRGTHADLALAMAGSVERTYYAPDSRPAWAMLTDPMFLLHSENPEKEFGLSEDASFLYHHPLAIRLGGSFARLLNFISKPDLYARIQKEASRHGSHSWITLPPTPADGPYPELPEEPTERYDLKPSADGRDLFVAAATDAQEAVNNSPLFTIRLPSLEPVQSEGFMPLGDHMRERMAAKPGGVTVEDEWLLHLNDCRDCTALGWRCVTGANLHAAAYPQAIPPCTVLIPRAPWHDSHDVKDLSGDSGKCANCEGGFIGDHMHPLLADPCAGAPAVQPEQEPEALPIVPESAPTPEAVQPEPLTEIKPPEASQDAPPEKS